MRRWIGATINAFYKKGELLNPLVERENEIISIASDFNSNSYRLYKRQIFMHKQQINSDNFKY